MAKIRIGLYFYCRICRDCEAHCPAFPCHEVENQLTDYEVEVKLVKKEGGKDDDM